MCVFFFSFFFRFHPVFHLSIGFSLSCSCHVEIKFFLPRQFFVVGGFQFGSDSGALNGDGRSNRSMYRPNFCQAFTRPVPFPSLFPPTTTPSVTSAGLGLSGLENLNGLNGGSRGYTSHSNISPLPIVSNGNLTPHSFLCNVS